MPGVLGRKGLLSSAGGGKKESFEFKGFPTSHPYVENKDGSRSNVLLSGFNINGREYVIPTMVGGKMLSPQEAVSVAKSYGLSKYPSFATREEADKFALKYHSMIGEDGKVLKKSVSSSIQSLIKR